MANEARITASLQIKRAGSRLYQSQPTAFTANATASGAGPSPGDVLCSTGGTNIDLSQLTSPSLCRIQNCDTVNYVTVGVWDPVTAEFFPLLDILPGEFYPLRLSRWLGKQRGSGSVPWMSNATRLRIKADTAPCRVIVEAFDK